MDSLGDWILGSILIMFIVSMFIIGLTAESDYIYICTDTQGNTVYCTSAYEDDGGMLGITEDGTKLQLTSYKRIKREEAENE